ncbi:MAG: amino acid adenylation domain-containing protein [Actinomycetota bacterium]
MNPSDPASRVAFMLQDSGATAVLTHSPLARNAAQTSARVIRLDADRERIEQGDPRNPNLKVAPESGCYVIYTSGSTGTPKGVVMPHRALMNLVEWHRATGSISRRVLQFASLTFDVSFQEIFSTLGVGGTLVLVPDAARIDMAALGRFIAENAIERFHLPVVVLQRLAEEFCENQQPLSSLRELMVGGEQLQITAPMVRLFEKLSDCALYNHYGPSETHVVTSCLLRGAPANWPLLPPLGRPIANTRAYALDPHLQPVPLGTTGELYLGGECVAHGYLGRPALTAKRFVPDPFSSAPGARMYKTGDLVRYAASGDIEFIGRNDFQIKIRGMRVELAEIEMELRQHPSVREVVVTVRQDDRTNEKTLAAYLVPKPEAAINSIQLRESLRERLPEHMVPTHFTVLQDFPLTRSGKINRLALPAPEDVEPAAEYLQPATAVEKALSAIFTDVLGRARVGVGDNFFDLGGHSLMATQIASRVREAFRIELPVRAIFEEPTVAGLARFILRDEKNRRRIELAAEVLAELPCGEISADAEVAETNRQNAQKADSSITPEAGPATPGHGSDLNATRIVRSAPLSFAQQRLWFLDQYDPQSTLYNLPAALRLQGPLDVAALEKSLNEIIQRHESLRTTFEIAGERPVQIVHEPSFCKLPITDLRNLGLEESSRTANKLIAEEAERGFDLANGPLLRTQLIRISPTDHIFLVTMHHIVSDGWSIKIFIHELAAFYDANCRNHKCSLPDLPIQYADFALWQREWLQGAVLSGQLEYWRKQLADAPPLLEFPTDRPRPAYKTFHGSALVFSIAQQVGGEIASLGRQEGATLFMALVAGFYVLLYRYTGQEDIVIGTPIAGRNRRDVEELIGFFINTLVVRTRVSGAMSFRELLQHVREICLQAYTHQDVPFEKLVEELHPERNLSHSPLFQTMFHLQNVLNENLVLSGLSVSVVETQITKAKFDISLAMSEGADGLRGILNYNTDLFDRETIHRIATHFEALLRAAVQSADEQISRLPMLSAEEKKQIVAGWNDCRRDYERGRLVHEILEEQARQRPHAPAVRFQNTTLTYAELNGRANRLAYQLRELGVGPEHIVGICAERSLEMMVGLFGILKAGAAYLPFDPAYPRARLDYMLDDAGVKVLVTQRAVAQQLPAREVQRVYLDSRDANAASESFDNLPRLVRPENLAYVIYTSGSTGKPKGIMIEHRTLANYIGWANTLMFDDHVKTVPAVQGLTFDGSLKQLFAPLLRGLEIWLLSTAEITDPVSLIEALSAHRDIRFSAVPSLWKAILDALESGQAKLPKGVFTRALIGGEELPKSVADRSFALFPELLLWNLYGPSEITATATAALIRPGDQITLGKPIAGKKVHILDRELQPLPPGIAGEIYIGREGLARGYLGRPDLTAENFIPDPFSEEAGARLYRTRDRARYLADGRIEFLGRSDHQVKLRGFRIELGEIEASLREHNNVREAVAVIKTSGEGEQQLVAYVVPSRETAPAGAELREFLKDRLPDYMLPSAWVAIESLPLTATGKLNRAALPEPKKGKREIGAEFAPARTAVEETIAEIFAEVLGISPVGIHDNFFELGGHSLLATRVVNRIRKTFKADLALRRFFEAPTVAGIATTLSAQETVAGRMEETAVLLRKIDTLSADDLEELLRKKRAKEGRMTRS